VLDYFTRRWVGASSTAWEGALSYLQSEISSDQNDFLCWSTIEEEIEKVVIAMTVDKVPGPDGILVEFYKKC